jgi:predicted  nucleic acid-binding Zn-ribbon protein
MTEAQSKGEKKTLLIILIILVLALTASNVITYINLQNAHQQYNILQSNYSALKSNYNKLSDNYSGLKSSYDKLSQDYQDLQLQYSSLRSDYSTLSSNYNKLNISYSSLKSDYITLQSNYQNLQQQYNDLSNLYSNLKANYNELSNNYSSLKSSYGALQSNYYTLSSYYKGLSQNVLSLKNLLDSYAVGACSFSRTLNEKAVSEVSSAVSSATGGSTSSWDGYQKIFNYIVSNIKYTNDIDMPVISSYGIKNIDGFDYITDFMTSTTRNYIQTPGLTLEIKQGDCDDQAILAYAMIKYYMKRVVGTEYSLYIASISFYGHPGHYAVFLPVQGGQVCIIDPAGNYLTKTVWGTITSKPAQQELQAYSNYWSSYGSISGMALYDVSIIDGSYKVVAEGDLSQIIAFLSNS